MPARDATPDLYLMGVRVATAQDAAAVDAAAVGAGLASRALMRVAGANAAAVIARRYSARLAEGVTVYTGPGNNGGDGWVVAGALAATGVRVHVRDVIEPRTGDAIAERDAALAIVAPEPHGGCGVVVDALLGTGARGAPRGEIAVAIADIRAQRARGAAVVSLDIPTGVDANVGRPSVEGEAVAADLTVSFGTCKRGHLLAREQCGDVVVVDIGVAPWLGSTSRMPELTEASWVYARIPRIASDAHKGARKKLAIVAGRVGMAGAAILAAEGALRSGIGMVRIVTDPANVPAINARVPEVLTAPLPRDDADVGAIAAWADACVIGPGLGASHETRELTTRLLGGFRGPVVLDADALNAFAGDVPALGALIGERPAVITPHPAELARLASWELHDVLAERFDCALPVADALGAAVLLKGTPTVVTGPDGSRMVCAAGTAALATAGSGDVLGGIVATLLAQGCEPGDAAACGAWVHGRAAELCVRVRGATLHDVVRHLPAVWEEPGARAEYPVMAELPGVA